MLAATITPPVKPNMESRKLRFIVLKKKTNAAPNAVTSQVKVAAYNYALGYIMHKVNTKKILKRGTSGFFY
jgi:hypothetical protein